MQLRPYQKEAIAATWRWFRENPSGAPLIVLPTGSGKSHCIAAIAKAVAEKSPDNRVLILAPRKELVQQNHEKLHHLWPFGSLGIYSAGMRRRDTDAQVIFAGIHSVYRRAEELGRFSLVIIDEVHLVPPEGNGMYRTLIEGLKTINPGIRFVGLSATPYRLGSGMLTEGKDPLFTEVAYDANIKDLIDAGYLSPLISKSCASRPDLSKIQIRNGEYVAEQMEAAFNRLDLVQAALAEALSLGADRKSWLIFASGVSHAKRIAEVLSRVGIKCGVVTGETTPLEREAILADFKEGRLKALANCEVLTTGYDYPGIDFIVVMRATKSTSLWVQMCGRGARLAEGKANCLIADMAENALTHGPLDKISISYRRSPLTGRQEGRLNTPPMKECFVCRSVVPISIRECPDCSTPFPEPARINHGAEASDAPILSGQPEPVREVDVLSVKFKKWKKEDKPHPTLRCDYVLSALADVPISTVPEWVCLEHPSGFARDKAVTWWLDRVRRHEDPIPTSIDEALSRLDELRTPKKIQIQRDGKYWRVIKILEFYPDDEGGGSSSSSDPDLEFMLETGFNI